MFKNFDLFNLNIIVKFFILGLIKRMKIVINIIKLKILYILYVFLLFIFVIN